MKRNYDRVASFYETLAQIYSTGAIRQSKQAQMKYLEPGFHVLYLGVGSGEDALMACRQGAAVTCVDLSQNMLSKAGRRISEAGHTANLVCADVHQFEPQHPFDVVITNYFLNCFREPEMARMMQRAARFLRPQGTMLIADVAPSRGNPASRLFNIVYLKMAMIAFWVQGLVPLHKNYDYPRYFDDAGLKLKSVEYFRFARLGPILFQNIAATKRG